MVKKAAKKQLDINSEVRRWGVLFESMNDGVKLIAEQYGDIKKDIGSIKKGWMGKVLRLLTMTHFK